MIQGYVFGLLAIFMTWAAYREGHVLLRLLEDGHVFRTQRPIRYWLCVASNGAGSALSLGVAIFLGFQTFR